jgi:hypothetical protein
MRKRKTSRRRKSNPTARGKKVFIRVNGRRGKRTTARRRRNPSALGGLGLLKDGAVVAVGSMATTFARGLIPFSAGGAIGDAFITGLVGVGLGELAARFISQPVGKLVTLGGVAAAANTALTNYNLTPQAIFGPRPAPAPVKAVPAGMRDIVALRAGAYDPYYGTTPRVGMGDIVTRPPQPVY